MAAASTHYQESSPASSVAAASPRVIEPDSDGETPDDVESILSSTRSVNPSLYESLRENGRTYHRYAAGSYLLPNDNPEIERMNLQYEVLKCLFGGRLHFAPLSDPRQAIDIGTGTGKWAIEFADKYPHCRVTATDLSAIQPQRVPENVKFLLDDASDPDWGIPPNHLDYVHTRVLLGCFEDFREIIKRGFHYLKPGAYMESQEMYPTIYCDDGTMPSDYAFTDWTRTLDMAMMNFGCPMRTANKLKRWYQEAGFVDVKEEVYKLPVNSWPKDPQFKLLGKFHETTLLDGVQGFSLAAFTRYLSWTKEEVEVYLVNVRKAISDRSVHAYHKIYVVHGRKPF